MGSSRSDSQSSSLISSLFSIVGLLAGAAVVADGSREPEVPCYFIFGDSLFDPGNNNNLNTTMKANYPPYGVDFPSGVATGRYSNGRTTADIIGELLGFESFIPPFASAPNNSEILVGRMHVMGARKVGVTGVNLIGCTPAAIAMYGDKDLLCVDSMNKLVVPFNERLKAIIDKLNVRFTDAKFVYLDSVTAGGTFPIKSTACCKVSLATGMCIPNVEPCKTRRAHAFWDAFHPSEAASRLIAPFYLRALKKIL
ncbi:unnamed protein product [Linum tenue]|uniref:GDSL esterase/lipase n=1 Tax=Linum tenue TaxID=586396 RepID=A0AAV0PYN3_9ROSI|nr:unnamed protein product [Linum tenue]